VVRFHFYAHLLRSGVKNTPGVYLEKRQICFFSITNLEESTMSISKTVIYKATFLTTGNSNMVAKPEVLISPKV